MYHAHFRGTHYEAGFRWGSLLLKHKNIILENIPFEITQERIDYALSCLPIYEKYYHEIMEEIQGLADGQQCDVRILQAALFSMYSMPPSCNCSCFAFTTEHEILLGRNSDFLTEIERLNQNVVYKLTDGVYSFTGNTTAFVEIEDGVNEHGLSVGLTSVYPNQCKPGFNAGMIVRYLLEKCKNVSEAVSCLYQLPIASAQTLTLADAMGTITVIECNAEQIKVEKTLNNNLSFVCATNTFHFPEMIGYNNDKIDNWFAEERYQTLYSAFYTKIVKNVQMFGQLRTIGMTKKQIKKMARKEGRSYALAGIPCGLIVGALIGFSGCPDGFHLKTTVIYAVITAAIAFIVVNIAIFKSVRVAMNTSPVESSKYIAYAGKAKNSQKLHRKLTPLSLAKINLQRNKQKAILTLLMLGLSGAFLLVTSTVAGSIDPEKQASFKYYPAGNILIQIKNTIGSSFDKEADPYGSSKLQLEENPLEDNALLQELEMMDGIEKITPSNCIYMTITFPGGGGSITSITNFFPTLNQEEIARVQTILSAGTANYDDMVAQNGILVAEDTAKVGDELKISGSTFDIEATVVGTYNRAALMEHSPVIPGSPYFIMTYDTAKKLTGITEQTGVLALEVSDDNFETVLSAVSEIAERNGKIEVNTIEQTIASIQKYYSPTIKTFYMISAILFVFGGISLMNMLMVDLQNRKREFGLLRAVGTTQNQLRKMLNRELMIYLAGSLLIALVVSSIASFITCKRLDAANHCISFSFPWLFLLAFVILLMAIYFVFSLYTSGELKNTDIMEAIRE